MITVVPKQDNLITVVPQQQDNLKIEDVSGWAHDGPCAENTAQEHALHSLLARHAAVAQQTLARHHELMLREVSDHFMISGKSELATVKQRSTALSNSPSNKGLQQSCPKSAVGAWGSYGRSNTNPISTTAVVAIGKGRDSARLSEASTISQGISQKFNAKVNALSRFPSMFGQGKDVATRSKSMVFRGLFVDAEVMKEKVRQAIAVREYKVADYYRHEGLSQWVARQVWFETVSLVATALNALWIAIELDYNKEDWLINSHPAFQVIEHLFCLVFACEWFIRFTAFQHRCDGFRDNWFVFDTSLVSLMVIETWTMTIVALIIQPPKGSDADQYGNTSVLRLLRILRITRVARIMRLLKQVPELLILIKGVGVAARSVFFTLCLLVMVIYVFAIAFTQMTSDTPVGQQYFSTVPISMKSLLLYGVFLEDIPDLVNLVGDENLFYGAMLLIFILVATWTILNMLIGILVEVVGVVSAVEKEKIQVSYVKYKLQKMMAECQVDTDNDNLISRSEFVVLLQKPAAAQALQDVHVDVVGLVDFLDFIFPADDQTLTFAAFMDMVLSLRGTNVATVKDIIDMRKFLVSELKRFAPPVAQY